MEEIEQLENGKLLFHSYDALKKYCDDVNNPLDKVVLGEEITALNSEDENGNVEGLFEDSGRTNEQFAGVENWDVSNVTDMNSVFLKAKNFNQPLNEWGIEDYNALGLPADYEKKLKTEEAEKAKKNGYHR